jgi:hypothetical protein
MIFNSSIYSCLSSDVAYFYPRKEQKQAIYLMFGENLSEEHGNLNQNCLIKKKIFYEKFFL